MNVIAFVPSLMISLTFATSIDYSLFMLARFCEEQRLGKSVHESIILMLDSAGMTILMSGATLMVCFLGLLFFSMDLLQSVGVGAACTMCSVLLSTLTLMPALLYMWGEYIMVVHSYVNMEKLPVFGHLSPDYLGNFFTWVRNTCYSYCVCCGGSDGKHRHRYSESHTSDSDNQFMDNFDHSGDLLVGGYLDDRTVSRDRDCSTNCSRDHTGTMNSTGDRDRDRAQRVESAPKERSEEDEEILLALGTSILSDLGDNTLSFDDHRETTAQPAWGEAANVRGRGGRFLRRGWREHEQSETECVV